MKTKVAKIRKAGVWAAVVLALALCFFAALPKAYAGFATDGAGADADEAPVAVLPNPSVIYRIGASLTGEYNVDAGGNRYTESEIAADGGEEGETVTQYEYADLAGGYNAAVTKAKERKWEDNPVVKIVLERNWVADKETQYDTLTRFGDGTGFMSGMLSVPYGTTVILDLNGKEIDRALTGIDADYVGEERPFPRTVNGSVINVQGRLLVTDTSGGANGAIKGGKATYGGGIKVESGAELYLYNGTIGENNADMGGGVAVSMYGIFTMFGGRVEKNKATVAGGGVSADSGRFEALGGSVCENECTGNGGGLYSSSLIDWLHVEANAYALYDASGKTLAQRKAEHGGDEDDGYGDYDYGSSSIGMTTELRCGAKICDNYANTGGGIYYTIGSCTVIGACIENNSAVNTGGIYGESILVVGGGVKVRNNVSEYGNDYGTTNNINLANDAYLYADSKESFIAGETNIQISNRMNRVKNYDIYNVNSSGTPNNLDDDGLPVNPATFISYADCGNEYRVVRDGRVVNRIAGTGEVYASRYYAKWDMYFINSAGTFGRKITSYRNDDAQELEKGYSVTFSFGDYSDGDVKNANRYAVGFKANIYDYNGNLVQADAGTRMTATAQGSDYDYVSDDKLGWRWQVNTQNEYNGEKFYLLVNYKRKSINDSDVAVTIKFDSSKLTFRYSTNDNYHYLEPAESNDYGFWTVSIKTGTGEVLQSGRDYDVRARESERSVFPVHVSDRAPFIITAKGHYTGEIRRDGTDGRGATDDDGREYKLQQSGADYYFTRWQADIDRDRKEYRLPQDAKPAFVYTGKDMSEKISLVLTVGNIPNKQELINKGCNDFTQTIWRPNKNNYSTDDRALRIRLYVYNGENWVETPEAVKVGKYKAALTEDYGQTNSYCKYLASDAALPADKPDDTRAYFDLEFDVVANLIDFSTVFSTDKSCSVYENDDPEYYPPRFYLKDLHNVRHELGKYVGLTYWDNMLKEYRVANFIPAGAAYMGEDGKVKYVGENDEISYVYYRGRDFGVSLSDTLVINALNNGAFLPDQTTWYDPDIYWENVISNGNPNILHYYGKEMDFSDYFADNKHAQRDVYYGGMRITDIAEVTARHSVKRGASGDAQIVDGAIKGGSGEVVYVTSTVEITFIGYADADGGGDTITLTKKWAIVSACNGIINDDGNAYIYAENEIEYGGGNQSSPRPQYGDTLILGVTDPDGVVTKCVVTYGDGILLYAYDENAEDTKGAPIDGTFAAYVMGAVAVGGVGDYTLSAKPVEYYNPRDGLVYAGAEAVFAFKVVPAAVTADYVTANVGSAVYSGNALQPDVAVICNGFTVPESDYTLTYENNVDAGTGKVTVVPVAGGVLAGQREFAFTIDKATDNAFTNLYLANWFYTKFDGAANRVFADSKYGYTAATFAVKKIDDADASNPVYSDVSGLTAFTADKNGVIEDGAKTRLNALPAGNYLLVASVADTSNYNGAAREYAFEVFATEYEAPTLMYINDGAGKNDVYTGYELSIVLQNYNPVGMEIVATDEGLARNGQTLYATDAGEYAITFRLTDTVNSKWHDADGSECTVVWKIAKKTVAVPTTGNNSFIVTGKPIIYTPDGYDETVMNIVGNERTGAGAFDVLITLKDPDNYQWEASESGATYGAVIVRSFTVIGAMVLFIIIMCALGGLAFVAGVIAFAEYFAHKQRLKVFAIANESKEEEGAK